METFDQLMLLIKYIFLGLLQGVSEPLPISSSGHILIVKEFFNIHIKGLSFEMIVNFGSLIAVFLVYRRTILRLIVHSLAYLLTKREKYKEDFQFSLLLVIATIPAGCVGLIFGKWIENTFSSVITVGVALFVTGFALWSIQHLVGHKNDYDITWIDAIIVGLAQTVALIPGISRSGATIVAAMLVGMKRRTALRFSFLLYLPVSFGVSLLSVKEVIEDPYFHPLLIPYTIALITAILATFFALKWFVNLVVSGHLKYFVYYCFLVGTMILIFH